MSHAFLYFLSLVAARTAVIATVLVVGFRLLGKRHLGQMNIFDIILIMALGNSVQNAMTSGTGDLWTGIISAGTLILMSRFAARVFVSLPKFEEQIVGNPRVLVNEGVLATRVMQSENISEAEVLTALREHGVCEIEDAKLVVLEVDGSISVVPKDGDRDGVTCE